MIHHQKFSPRGFTLIEMLVALALFSVIITIVVGSFLSLISFNQATDSDRLVMDNLVFALDGMTRDFRSGTYYYCGTGASSLPVFSNPQSLNKTTSDCFGRGSAPANSLHGVSVIESGTANKRITYYHDPVQKTIMRKVANGAAQRIISEGVSVDKVFFFVTGSATLETDPSRNTIQPTVTIVLEASLADSVDAYPIQLQTTVTQRSLDI